MNKYQALIDALKAGPTDGPWFEHHDKGHLYIENQRDDVVCDMGRGAKSCPTSQYIAAANPATIRSLLADLEMAEKALRFYADPWRYQGPNQRLDKPDEFSPNDAVYLVDVTRDYGCIAKAALSQLKGQQ